MMRLINECYTTPGAGGRNTCEPKWKCIMSKDFCNHYCWWHVPTWIDLMNGNSMDIQQIIRILLQSLTLVTSAHCDWIQFLSLWCLLRNNSDWWWHSWMFDGEDWAAELLAVFGSTKQKMMVHFFSDFVVQLWQFFLRNDSNWEKNSLAVSNNCFFLSFESLDIQLFDHKAGSYMWILVRAADLPESF